MDVPAFCDTCGAVFRSGVVAGNVTNISFGNVGAGPCPMCGGMGHIPDGVFNFIGNTIEILSAPHRTVEELSRLTKIIREARERKETPEQVAEKIRNEIPTLAGLADLLPRTRDQLYAFLALIVAVIALVGQSGDGKKQSTNITVNQIINQVFIETEKAAQSPPKPTTTPKAIGRNASCPCGSGKKYKKCCGKVQ